MKRQAEADDLTLLEYQMLMKAYALRSLDEEYKAHKQAWLNQQVQATKQQGKKTVPVYRKFKQFFDYEKHEQEILGANKKVPKQNKKIISLMLQANS